MRVISRRHQAARGTVTPFSREETEAEAVSMALMWQSGDQATYLVLSVMRFCQVLPEPPQVDSQPIPSPCRSLYCSDLEQPLLAKHLPAGPGCPQTLGEHGLLPRDSPWLFGGRDPVSVTSVCHRNLFLTPAGAGSSHNNRSAFSTLQNESPRSPKPSLLWSVHQTQRPLLSLSLKTVLVLAFAPG